MTDSTGSTGYAPVNGLEMYYESHGTGEPLVLLHGALTGIGLSFGKILPGLAAGRRVVAVEQQGHGHTADIDRPLSLEQMANDTLALLEHLGIERTDLFGWSMGAGIAFQIAVQHPDLVRKLVLASLSVNLEGLHPGLQEGLESMKPEDLDGSPFQQEYLEIAPHPENWHRLIEKNQRMDVGFQGWPLEAVRSITAPTFLIIGDSDIVQPEHAVAMFRLLGGGVIGDLVGLPRSRLAILPGTTHVTVADRGEWLLSMVTEFLDAPSPRRPSAP